VRIISFILDHVVIDSILSHLEMEGNVPGLCRRDSAPCLSLPFIASEAISGTSVAIPRAAGLWVSGP
jgi:hypothetical protein